MRRTSAQITALYTNGFRNLPQLSAEQRARNLYKRRQQLARYALNRAVKEGRVAKPQACTRCGHDGSKHRLEAHHADYGKPLDVEWLCQRCHTIRHCPNSVQRPTAWE